jgi:hypothetical protein
VIILDWDDTLLTTSRLTSFVYGVEASKPLPGPLRRELHELGNDVVRLLESCISRGRVVIVTNAVQGWVQQSGRKFMPEVIAAISRHNIQVVSAQSTFAHTCSSGSPADWKKKAFVHMPELKEENINLVSIGDSTFERDATHFVSRVRQNVVAAKTVKFIHSPTIEQLRRQLVMLTDELPIICELAKTFDVDVEI